MVCFVDYRISDEEIISLNKLHMNPIKIPKSNLVYPSINGHVDIQLNILNKKEKKVIVHKDISKEFLEYLSINKISYVLSNSSLGYKYPHNVILNALITNNLFLHNLKYSDKNLIASQNCKEIINVNQGYTKCSVLPINEKAFITSDIGIYNTLNALGYDLLYISSKDILLPGLNHGFIGGVGGMISSNKLAFFGELPSFEQGDEVYSFLYKYDVEPIYLKKGKLIDRGSLLSL